MPAPVFNMRHRPGAIGEAMARGPGLIPAREIALDNADEATPRGSVSAALGGGRQVPNRHLRQLMLLERGDPLMGMMMAEMLVVMPAHFGVGVQHAVLGLRGLDHRYMRLRGGRHAGGG